MFATVWQCYGTDTSGLLRVHLLLGSTVLSRSWQCWGRFSNASWSVCIACRCYLMRCDGREPATTVLCEQSDVQWGECGRNEGGLPSGSWRSSCSVRLGRVGGRGIPSFLTRDLLLVMLMSWEGWFIGFPFPSRSIAGWRCWNRRLAGAGRSHCFCCRPWPR